MFEKIFDKNTKTKLPKFYQIVESSLNYIIFLYDSKLLLNLY